MTFVEMREKELELFIIEFNKGSQLDRSFKRSNLGNEQKIEFRKELVKSCKKLIKRIDNDTLTNKHIRKEIDRLKNIDGNISYGQAQKVVNVCLKQYCFLMNKSDLIKELDCPLDSTTMKNCKIENDSMYNVEKEDYLEYQEIFKKQYGERIFRDIEYDELRIENFYN